VVVDRSGREREIPGGPLDVIGPRVSPDGKRIAGAVLANDRTLRDVTLIDVATGARQRLVETPRSPVVTWDRTGERVIYIADSQTARELVSRAWDRSSQDIVLTRDSALGIAGISPGSARGFTAVFVATPRNSDIYIAPSDFSAAPRPFVATAAMEVTPEVSPNGRWLAYASNESDTEEIYVQPIPGPGPRLQVSVNGGAEPVWGTDEMLYYRAGGRLHVAILGGLPLQLVRRDSLFVDVYDGSRNVRTWDVFPGGREFLFVRSSSEPAATGVMVVLNWQQMVGPQRTDSRER
jgi:hypothetical protein